MKARYFVILAIICAVVTILGMRHNFITAHEMLEELQQKDKAGEDISNEKKELFEFVASHMNATGPDEWVFTLDGMYERELEAAQAQAREQIDDSVYEEAVAECDREGVATVDNAECVQEYLDGRIDGHEQTELPERDDFTVRWESPTWTPDVPGVAALIGTLSAVMALVLYARYWIHQLKG